MQTPEEKTAAAQKILVEKNNKRAQTIRSLKVWQFTCRAVDSKPGRVINVVARSMHEASDILRKEQSVPEADLYQVVSCVESAKFVIT